MSQFSAESVLARLQTSRGTAVDEHPVREPATAELKQAPASSEESVAPEQRLDEVLARVRELTGGAPDPTATAQAHDEAYFPVEPTSLREAKLSPSEVEGLILKLLLSRGDLSGRAISDHIKLGFLIIEELLRQLKADQLVVHKGSAPMNDYIYQLTDLGRERGRRLSAHCTYFGAAPVALSEYIKSVKGQSLTKQHPTATDLHRAFEDLLVNTRMLNRLGPAINSGRGLFLFGAAGNGKTSIAERVTRAFGDHIWIPRAIGVDGEIIRVYDPNSHEELPVESGGGIIDQRKLDRRWVRIRRPTIIVGGELTMDNLELQLNAATGISEAPVQLKSNCGTLVIDDFGRQRMSTHELLNRWIVPLEKRYDFLNLASGKKIQVPFDQLIIFSTNLEPKQLVDDAFLRRIPYKIEVLDPTPDEFRGLFKLMAPKLGFEYNDEAVTYLICKHYEAINRPMRCCQPRDLLLQVKNHCAYHGTAPQMTHDSFDFAVENYFAVM